MKTKRHCSGSVLMEFIIVLPIYMCVLGGLFAIGDAALTQHLRLTDSRVAAWLPSRSGASGWSRLSRGESHASVELFAPARAMLAASSWEAVRRGETAPASGEAAPGARAGSVVLLRNDAASRIGYTSAEWAGPDNRSPKFWQQVAAEPWPGE